MTTPTAAAIIAQLDLAPHPEGGWFRETWRAEDAPDPPPGARTRATAILFLLDAGERSHWHQIDAAEIWLWHAGSSLALSTAQGDEGPVATITLGPDVLAGEMPQHIIATGHWQAAATRTGWSLVSCVVSPGFDFAGFTLAPKGWEPGTAV